MQIRPCEPGDLPHLHDICLRTGDAGADASATCSDPRLLGDYFAAPYPAFDPSMCLTLTDAEGPCGYILGALDTREFAAWFNTKWLPRIRAAHHGLQARAGARDVWLIELIQRDMDIPPCAEAYPAHLHIDLLPRAQGLGWGRRLFLAWTGLAAARHARGVHLGVSRENAGAIRFYERMGMSRIDAGPRALVFGLKLPVTT